jgi:uncharacterized protein
MSDKKTKLDLIGESEKNNSPKESPYHNVFTPYADTCFTSELQKLDTAAPYYHSIKTLDELLERDKQREKDGFRRKINIGKIVKPGRGKKNKVVIVPTTTEDKFYHDNRVHVETDSSDDASEGEVTGAAEGEEGDVIGESPLQPEGMGDSTGAGTGSGEEHEVLSNAYDLGKILTEKFKLPNLKDKGKKKSLTKFIYDLTDRNRGSGQILDKKRTLMQIIKTNINLKRLDAENHSNTDNLLINPHDYIYKTLSRERDTEAQAVVFFIRDYSGSMYGKPTELICSQHVMIFSWLIYQFREQVESRFILHDTEAKEVDDFHTYYNTNVAGGTCIQSSIEYVNKIVETENLAKDYNIYVFYGGDGDDWNPEEDNLKDSIKKMLSYVSRMGITIVNTSTSDAKSKFESFIDENNFLKNFSNLIRMDVIEQDVDEKRLIEGIKKLVSEEKVH